MSSEKIVIDVCDLSKRYEIYKAPRDRLKQMILPRLHQMTNRTGVAMHIMQPQPAPRYFREFWALRNVSFQVRRGETLGIIGRNGSGKSTLLQIIAGTLASTAGNINVNGRVAALLELGSGFSPEFSGRENVFLNGRILGLSQREIQERYDQIVEFADIGEFIEQPVKTYSSGMFLRLAFAVQAHIDASIIIIDEALTVGDVFFRKKCYTRLEQLRNGGTAILLVSHSMPDIEQYCERAVLLEQGKPQFIGPSSEAAKHYYLLNQTDRRVVAKPAAQSALPRTSTTFANKFERPLSEAFIDIDSKSQIGDGSARCVGVALCNETGMPCNSFRQGELAVFYYEFELIEDIGMPICGIIVQNEYGTIVHGKNSWQFENDVPVSLGIGSKILCRQKVKLDIGPGEYIFEVGLASVSNETWAVRETMSHEEMSTRRIRNCHIANAGSLTVGLAIRNGVSKLTHHGIADLAGDMSISVEQGRAPAITLPRAFTSEANKDHEQCATVFHVTHWKAGSQWVNKILTEIASDRIVAPQLSEKQFLNTPLVTGAIYPTVYVTREQFQSVALPDNYKKFVIMRDLRDTLVSGYFSIRHSHAVIDKRLADWRQRLASISIEDGLLLLMAEWLPFSARIQQSWVTSGEKFMRYEDLLENDVELFEEALIRHCEISIDPERLRDIIMNNRFENVSDGRKSGEENIMAHARKGIPGDWRNYFTPAVTDKFNAQYSDLLVEAGYQLEESRIQ